MTRPGIGNWFRWNGQWVLTWLKRDYSFNTMEKCPPMFIYLKLIPRHVLEAGATRVSASGKKEEAAEVGGVKMKNPSSFM